MHGIKITHRSMNDGGNNGGAYEGKKLAPIKGYIPKPEKAQLISELKKERLAESKLLREVSDIYLKLRRLHGKMLDKHKVSALDIISYSLYSLIYDKSQVELRSIIEKLKKEGGPVE